MFGFAARFDRVQFQPNCQSYVDCSGHFDPGGGIILARVFRTTFSHSSAFSPTRDRSYDPSLKPPFFALSMWQPRQ